MPNDLTCPNCGRSDVFFPEAEDGSGRYMCMNAGCDTQGADCATEAEALAAWQMPAARADERKIVEAEYASLLSMPEAVYVNTLRGTIAKLSEGSAKNVYCELFAEERRKVLREVRALFPALEREGMDPNTHAVIIYVDQLRTALTGMEPKP